MTEVHDTAFASLYGGFWDSLRRKEISFPNCRRCGATHWYPMPRCPRCYSEDLQWLPVRGHGVLYSWTTVQRSFAPTFQAPYVVGLVEFPEIPGTRLVTNIVETAPDALRIGMPMEPVFFDEDGKAPLVRFRPMTAAVSRSTPCS